MTPSSPERIATEVERIAEPICAAHACELVQVEWGGGVLRVFVDRSAERGGVTLDLCRSVSRDLSAALDVADPIDGHYRLEVSSPGVDRPLAKERDFERFAGSRAKLRTREPVDGRRTFDGTILRVADGAVVLDQGGCEVAIRITEISKAHVVWEAPDTASSRRRGTRASRARHQ